jgi:lipase ATG15
MLRKIDIHKDSLIRTQEGGTLDRRVEHKVLSRPERMQRLSDRSKSAINAQRLSHQYGLATSHTTASWVSEDILQPNVTDKTTVLGLARIAANAYIEVERTEDWLEVGTPYNRTDDFGWAGDGLRGHIFADQDNSTVIIGLKGTSPAVFDGAETTTNDKVNDNLLFSCCCARVSYWWTTVCDCYSGTAYTCDNTCLKSSLTAEDRYYHASLQLYYNVTKMYPDSNIWVVGHSLGGAISSLLGQTFGLPVITFEAPGEALASDRLGLPKPPSEGGRQSSNIGIYHFGHTADPIYMGTCNGPTSACSIGGYAMETRCHAGVECVYDVVSDRGWRMALGYHRIQGVIKDIIETYDDVPVCTYDPGCVDCFNWKFIDGNQTHTTTSISITIPSTTTTTTTCYTPGWWGCRDITTTTPVTTSADSLTTITTTISSVSTPPTTSITQAPTTCTHYGWFGNCLDPTSNTPSFTVTSLPTSSSVAMASTETCRHYRLFGGCDDPVPTTNILTASAPVSRPGLSTTVPSTTGPPTPHTSTPNPSLRHVRHCKKRVLWNIGWCTKWDSHTAATSDEL